MAEKVQLVSDLQSIIRASRGSSLTVDVGTLVGDLWGLASVNVDVFEMAVLAVPDPDVLLRVVAPDLKFLDAATGTVEYASVEVGNALA
jgi:hypothetical protein